MSETIEKVLYDPAMGRLITAALALLVVVVIVKVVQRSLTRYIESNERRYRMRKIVTLLGYVVAVFVLSLVFSDRLSGLTVAFGVAGAGIAFALQEVIASIAGWVAMSLGKFYSVGDRVQLGGIRGDVIDVGILRTTILECGSWVSGDLYNGRIVRVANSFIFKEPVFNYSGDFPFLWDELTIPVRYGSDYQQARTIFTEILEDVTSEVVQLSKETWRAMTRTYMIEDARLEPMVTCITNDNWVEFTLRYVVDYKRRRTAKDEICCRVLDAVDKTRGRVMLGSTTFELTALPRVDVRVLEREKDRSEIDP